jgi:hypothetical protein
MELKETPPERIAMPKKPKRALTGRAGLLTPRLFVL